MTLPGMAVEMLCLLHAFLSTLLRRSPIAAKQRVGLAKEALTYQELTIPLALPTLAPPYLIAQSPLILSLATLFRSAT